MDVTFFEKVVSQVKEYTNQLYLHVMGEPLLHLQIDSILPICEKNNMQVNLTTNGTLLKKHITTLKNTTALRKLTISIQSYEANSLDWKNYLAQVVESVKQLPSSVIVEYRLWNWGVSTSAKEQVEYLGQAYGLDASYPTTLTDNKYDNGIKLGENIYIMFDKPFVWPSQSSQVQSTGYCPAITKQLAVLVDGSVVPCCLDSEGALVLGNLHNASLREILEGERAKTILSSFRQRIRVEGLCKHCQFINQF